MEHAIVTRAESRSESAPVKDDELLESVNKPQKKWYTQKTLKIANIQYKSCKNSTQYQTLLFIILAFR